jgi:hypothetical protein
MFDRNILLGEDGHIRLVDMGGVSNVDGSSIKRSKDDEAGELVPLFRGYVGLNNPDMVEEGMDDTEKDAMDEGLHIALGSSGAPLDVGLELNLVAETNADGDIVIAQVAQCGPNDPVDALNVTTSAIGPSKPKDDRSLSVMGTLG